MITRALIVRSVVDFLWLFWILGPSWISYTYSIIFVIGYKKSMIL